MAFPEDLARHADQIRARRDHVKGEEATKQALVVPFLQVLGYDVFDPREVKPEYVADFAVKKAGQFEKVDYAVFVADQPALFVECKSIGAALEDHGGQLARYFNATPSVRVAIITDGICVRVFTDLQQPNVMDPTPWLNINLLELKPAEIDALKSFRKTDFSPADAVALAEKMVFYNAMVAVLSAQFQEPTESFVRWVASEVPAVGARHPAGRRTPQPDPEGRHAFRPHGPGEPRLRAPSRAHAEHPGACSRRRAAAGAVRSDVRPRRRRVWHRHDP